MSSVLFRIGSSVIKALVFSDTNFLFSKLKDDGEKE